MSPRLVGLCYVTFAVLFEALGQLSFKVGAESASAQNNTLGLLRSVWRQRAVVLGVAFFAVEAVLWTTALRLLDVSLAFPAGSLCFVFVVVLSRLWLHEQISYERWIGVSLILGGVVLIGLS
jgi:drug/metabolite transporter (DMT)-like permease